MKEQERQLLDHWLWEPPMLLVFVLVGIMVPVLVSMLMMYTSGWIGLHALWFVILAPLIAIGYGVAGKKVSKLKRLLAPEDGLAIPGLMVRGRIEAAGLIVLGTEQLLLQPIVGKPSTITRQAILSFKESRVFNGSVMWGKTGFFFTTSDSIRLGCAIPNSYVSQFRQWLNEKQPSDT